MVYTIGFAPISFRPLKPNHANGSRDPYFSPLRTVTNQSDNKDFLHHV
jgi:hypothetical protein